jgi:hypothetical protein
VHGRQDFERLFSRHCRLVASTLDQGRKDIGNGANAGEVRDAFPAKPIRVAAAVEIFVVVTNNIEDLVRDAGTLIERVDALYSRSELSGTAPMQSASSLQRSSRSNMARFQSINLHDFYWKLPRGDP